MSSYLCDFIIFKWLYCTENFISLLTEFHHFYHFTILPLQWIILIFYIYFVFIVVKTSLCSILKLINLFTCQPNLNHFEQVKLYDWLIKFVYNFFLHFALYTLYFTLCTFLFLMIQVNDWRKLKWISYYYYLIFKNGFILATETLMIK